PLSVFLTPEKHPFFGGTYYPPYPRWGAPGFLQVLDSIIRAWSEQSDQVKESAAGITQVLSRRRGGTSPDLQLSTETLDHGCLQLASRYDKKFGGFGQAPKFPSPHQLMFLMRTWKRTTKKEVLLMVTRTLQAMSRGGICDHLGGGFHRYATDQQWQIPHFEKMLYDQAMISRAYLEAYQITKDEEFVRAAQKTFDYVLRDLTSPEGAFYSAEDADSVDPYDPDPHEKKEGAFYLWKETEIADCLGVDDAAVFNAHYQIQPDGNAHSDPHGDFEGKNILFAIEPSSKDVEVILQRCKEKLLQARDKRQRPHLDDKVLADWNGLMMASLAFGSRILKDKKYLQAAIRAADFIVNQMMDKQGKLLHRFRDGESGIAATLEDYAFVVDGLLEIYQTTLQARFLSDAKRLTDTMMDSFSDEERGGFYLPSKDTGDLPFRPKDIYDGASPSGNSMAAWNLLRLYRITFDERYQKTAQRLFGAFAEDVRQVPMGYTQLLIALSFDLGPSKEIAIAPGDRGLSVNDILDHLAGHFLPEAVVLGTTE
ncbi:MAG: thioredoxin domain-containing protein, partial [Candidatus Omnitrophica bacterium CG12_big_fil_rev_8_21_14_0_65_50_5]